MGINVFDNYTVHILIPINNESVEPELKNIEEKFQDKNELVTNNDLSDAR